MCVCVCVRLCFLPARRRPQGLVVIGVCLTVCLSVCVCALFLSARYLKNGFMDHHQIWWVGAGGEPLEQFNFGADRIPDAYPGSLFHFR